MHPDKSKLTPDYFLFYSKAYKMLYSIWEFRKKGHENKSTSSYNTDYTTLNDEEKKILLNKYFEENSEMKNANIFNKWFNEQFEKNKIVNENEEKGYESWLKSNENIDESNPITLSKMGEEFEKKKTHMKSIIVYKGVCELTMANTISTYELSNDAPDCFDSDLFSSLPYQDLQKAHTESVIPVTMEDYEKTTKFNTLNEYKSYRNQQDIKPLSESQAIQYLKEREKRDESDSVRVAYKLAKQTEMEQKRGSEFWSSLKLINNK